MLLSSAPLPLTLATLHDHMIWVEGGVFEMGDDHGNLDSKPVHPVQLSDFLLCRYAVTQGLWQELMENEGGSDFHVDKPMVNITWFDAIAWCNQLSLHFHFEPVYEIQEEGFVRSSEKPWPPVVWNQEANGYRLPTEAEWMYAARGGKYMKEQEYAGSPNLHEVAWCGRNSNGMSHPVGLKFPNELGLFDMNGNVLEWGWDWYNNESYSINAQNGSIQNPTGVEDGFYRRLSGGEYSGTQYFSLSYRNSAYPDTKHPANGFRLCRSFKDSSKQTLT